MSDTASLLDKTNTDGEQAVGRDCFKAAFLREPTVSAGGHGEMVRSHVEAVRAEICHGVSDVILPPTEIQDNPWCCSLGGTDR